MQPKNRDLFRRRISEEIIKIYSIQTIIEHSKENIKKWRKISGSTPGYDRWLHLSEDQFKEMMLSETSEAESFRSFAPYAGLIPETVRMSLIEEFSQF